MRRFKAAAEQRGKSGMIRNLADRTRYRIKITTFIVIFQGIFCDLQSPFAN